MRIIKGSITTVKGFQANGISAGIKKSGKKDLALIVSSVPAIGAGVFTKNSVKAAPLVVSIENLRNGKIQAIVVNSGNANCFTGKFGMLYARQTTELFGKKLGIPKEDIIVSSTGIIGKPLPYDKIQNASDKIIQGLSTKNGGKAAEAILTTDLKPKEICVQRKINGKTITIAGCAKGSGMVAPNMATMLGFITTDAAISLKMLKEALKTANDSSFNAITVDGCMSTNDMVVVMANGLAGNKNISAKGKSFQKFQEMLDLVCKTLAKKIVLDAEGATKFIEITVNGAKTEKQGRMLALQIANSNLVKTAAFGSNPNWGRVAAAIGSVGIKKISEENIKINFSPFKEKEIKINVNINLGSAVSTVYTCDLSYEYVKINGEYN